MKTLLRGALLALLLLLVACDAPLFEPSSVTVPSTDAPATCRGGGKNACPEPLPVQAMDSIWIYPQKATLEVGATMPYWMVGWFAGQPYACADDGERPVGRVKLNAAWLEGQWETTWTPETVVAPDVYDQTVIPDLSVCEIHVEMDDPSVAEWQPRSWLSAVSAWLREVFA